MQYGIYSIRDKHTGFMAPMIDMTDESAQRNFSLTVNSNPGVIGFKPEDFDLYKIGDFDIDSGIINPMIPPKFICNGFEVKKHDS